LELVKIIHIQGSERCSRLILLLEVLGLLIEGVDDCVKVLEDLE
jgi:hypothetical protein